MRSIRVGRAIRQSSSPMRSRARPELGLDFPNSGSLEWIIETAWAWRCSISMHSPPETPGPSVVEIGQRRCRVLLVLEASFAGAGRHVLDLAAGLLALGQDVHLVYSPRRMELRFARALFASRRPKASSRSRCRSRPEPGPRTSRASGACAATSRRPARSTSSMATAPRPAPWRGWRHRPRRPPALHTTCLQDDGSDALGRQFMLYGAVERLLARFATDRLLLSPTEEARHARSQGLPVEKPKVIPNGARIPDDFPDRALARARFSPATMRWSWPGSAGWRRRRHRSASSRSSPGCARNCPICAR